MKKLSIWAKHHKIASRVIIILSFILLTIIAYFTGTWFSDLGVIIPPVILFIALLLYLISIIAYPRRSGTHKKYRPKFFYVRQKGCDIVLAASTFIMMICLANNTDSFIYSFAPANAISVNSNVLPKDSSVKTFKSLKEFSSSMKDKEGKMLKWKERKKLLKEQVRGIKKTENLSKGDKGGLIVLSVLVALGLLTLIGALSCSIYCSGSEGAAILVGIGGSALVILLLVITIKAIKKGKKVPKEEPAG